MRAGLAASVVLHAAVLAYGLVAWSGPKPFDAGEVEAFPVDIVPVEEIAEIQEGDKTAALKETSAPKPTTKPQTVPDAQKAGDNEQDLSTPPTPEPRPREVKAAAEPPSAPEPTPKPVAEAKPEPAPPPPEPQAAPAVEAKPTVEPRQEVKPDPAPDAAVAEAAPDAETVTLPETAPLPQPKPKPPEAQTAKAPEKKAVEKPEKTVAETPKADKKEKSLEDEVAMLLSKEKASGGGAKRSTQEAALGGKKKTTGATKLSQGEMDALRDQLGHCWVPPPGMEGVEDLRVSVRFEVDALGKVDGSPVIEASSGNRQFDESAKRAILKCNQQGLKLPSGKADIWSEIVVNFDPSEMSSY